MYITISLVAIFFIWFVVRFYPRQSMTKAKLIEINTPEKYQNDCLHPCIRRFKGDLYMVCSPFPNRDDLLENPLLYRCVDEQSQKWEFICEVKGTPSMGYNSDPCLHAEDDRLYVFWREYQTENCKKHGVDKATFGMHSTDRGQTFSDYTLFLAESETSSDAEICPIMIKTNDRHVFYTVDYQISPKHKKKGMNIWEGNLTDGQRFRLAKSIKSGNTFTGGSYCKTEVFGKTFHIPKILKHRLWHFDLYSYNTKLYMVSVREWGNVIMLSVAKEGENFKTFKTPLVNTHYLGYPKTSKLYKSSFFIEDDQIHLFFTLTDRFISNRLYYTKIPLAQYE